MEENYYKINTLAKFFGITTWTIRYYEKYGVLTPHHVDENTKYRYYNIANVNTLAYILNLRQSGMDMAEIKEYLNNRYTREDFLKQLYEKRDHLNQVIAYNEAFSSHLAEIEEITIDEFVYFGKNYYAKTLEDSYKCFYDFLDKSLQYSETVLDPVAFFEFNSSTPPFENFSFRAGIKVAEMGKDCYVHPAVCGVRIFHLGSYDSLWKSYEKLHSYIKEKGYTPFGTSIERYHESFNLNKSLDEFLTEVIITVK